MLKRYFVFYNDDQPHQRHRGRMPRQLYCGSARLMQAASLVESAAHLADHVFPRLAVRQWVLSLPTSQLSRMSAVRYLMTVMEVV